MQKVSIIIPVYNAENYLKKCLDSIVNQTYKNLDIVLINDGSIDKSLNICNSYKEKDDRIQIIDQKNSGVSIARNNGIKIATGEYITFVDSDDWLELDAIEKMVNIIEKDNCDVIRTNYFINDDVISKESIKDSKIYNKNQIKEELIEKFLIGELNCYTVLLLIRKSILLEHDIFFSNKLCMMEDKLFYIQLLNSINNISLNGNCYTYHYFQNINSASKSQKNIEKNINSILYANYEIKEYLLKNNYNEKIIKTLQTNSILSVFHVISTIENLKYSNTKKYFKNIFADDQYVPNKEDVSYKNLNLYKKVIIFCYKNKFFWLANTMFKIKRVLKKIKR